MSTGIPRWIASSRPMAESILPCARVFVNPTLRLFLLASPEKAVLWSSPCMRRHISKFNHALRIESNGFCLLPQAGGASEPREKAP